jgi:hypothetical protein
VEFLIEEIKIISDELPMQKPLAYRHDRRTSCLCMAFFNVINPGISPGLS